MKRALLTAISLLALAGAAIAAVPILEDRAAAQIKAEIERDGAIKVGRVEVGLLDRRIALLDLKLAPGEPQNVVGRWEASGLAWPLGELLRGRTPLAGLRWGDPLRADRIELEGVSIVDDSDGSRWTVQSLVIDGFDLARFDATYKGQFPVQVRLARALSALAMRRLVASNLMVTMPTTADTFGIANILLDGYDRGRIATLAVNGFEAAGRDDPAPQFRIDDIKSTNLDLSRLLGSIASAGWHPGAPLGRLKVDKASIAGFGGELLARYGVSIGSMSLDTVHESDTASRSRTRIEGFALAPPRGLQGLQTRLALQAMGLKEVKLDLDCQGAEDRARGDFIIGPCVLVGPGLGEINFTAHIVDADKPFWLAIDDGDIAAINDSKAGLGSAKLVTKDRGLLERGLKLLSTMVGRPLAETRSNLAREIRSFQPTDVLISQDMTKFLDTVARFVERGGTLTIEAKPEPPLGLEGFRSLYRPGADIVRLLSLSASVTP